MILQSLGNPPLLNNQPTFTQYTNSRELPKTKEKQKTALAPPSNTVQNRNARKMTPQCLHIILHNSASEEKTKEKHTIFFPHAIFPCPSLRPAHTMPAQCFQIFSPILNNPNSFFRQCLRILDSYSPSISPNSSLPSPMFPSLCYVGLSSIEHL